MRHVNIKDFEAELKAAGSDTSKLKKVVEECYISAHAQQYKYFKVLDTYLDKELQKDPDIMYSCGVYVKEKIQAILTYRKQQKSNYFTGNEIIKFIKAGENYLNVDDKASIANMIVKEIKVFPYHSKNLLKKFLIANAGGDSALEVLKNYKAITLQDIDNLVDTITDKYENKEVLKILEGNVTFSVKQYTKEKIESDEKVRESFVKLVANKPIVMEKVDFDLLITIDDLKKLPTMTRFNLMSGFLLPQLDILDSVGKHQKWMRKKLKTKEEKAEAVLRTLMSRIAAQDWRTKVKIEMDDKEAIKDLLFAASIYSNDKVSNWFELYSEYLELKTLMKPLLLKVAENL